MSNGLSAADWRRLGELLARRRVELNPRYSNRTTFSAERGIDYRLAYDIEEARRANFRKTTLAAVAAAYSVTPDSLLGVLEGTAAELQAARAGHLRDAANPRPDIVHPVPAPEEEEFLASVLPMLRPEDQEVVRGILRLLDGEGRPWAWERKRDLILAYAGMVTAQRRQAAGLQILRVRLRSSVPLEIPRAYRDDARLSRYSGSLFAH